MSSSFCSNAYPRYKVLLRVQSVLFLICLTRLKRYILGLSRCQKTILEIEEKLQPLSRKKSVWSRIKVAATRDYFTGFQAQVLSEKQDLILQLEAFAW